MFQLIEMTSDEKWVEWVWKLVIETPSQSICSSKYSHLWRTKTVVGNIYHSLSTCQRWKMFGLRRALSSLLETQNDLDFEWSFQPLVIWMRVMGIQLHQSSGTHLCNILYGLLMFLFPFGCRCFDLSMSKIFSAIKIDGQKLDSDQYDDMWNLAVSDIRDILETLGIHLVMFVVSFWRWRPLWRMLQKMERAIAFGNDFYVTMRKASIGVVVYLCLVSWWW